MTTPPPPRPRTELAGEPPDPEHDPEEHWLEDHADAVLAGHHPACVEVAELDAYDHGIDDPRGARQVAAQFLEDGVSQCLCDVARETAPDPAR